jgi:acetyl-CoA carboxylase, biotin carboxylase subunit
MAAIKTLLIANRGEIAVRIIRAARELGIRTVQTYSAADANSLAVKLADVAVNIGPPQASKSYLSIEAVLAAARESEADAVHPGYGFLAENADFADAVEAANLTFVGPPGSVIRLMGDKAAARKIAAKAGVPTVPGSDGRIDAPEEAREVASRLGYPVMIKAAAGGGGRGIRIVNDRAELDQLAPQASAEANSSNASVLSSVAVRSSGRKRRPPIFPTKSAPVFAPAPCNWRGRFPIAVPARSNFSTMRRRAISISSK